MYKLKRLYIVLLALMLTVSMTSTSFADRKRKRKVIKEEPVEETVVKAEKKVFRKKVAKKEEIKEEIKIERDEEILFSFEKDTEDWEIPDWAWEKADHVAEESIWSKKYASDGKGSFEIQADFPGKKWTAAYLEYVEYFDWTDYSEVAVDIYIPEDTPVGLMGKIIITVGEDWKWVEMRRPKRLKPGEWITVRANLMPGSTDWRRVKPDDEFRMDVRKLGIRIESDKKPVYKGNFYVDNIRLTKLEK